MATCPLSEYYTDRNSKFRLSENILGPSLKVTQSPTHSNTSVLLWVGSITTSKYDPNLLPEKTKFRIAIGIRDLRQTVAWIQSRSDSTQILAAERASFKALRIWILATSSSKKSSHGLELVVVKIYELYTTEVELATNYIIKDFMHGCAHAI